MVAAAAANRRGHRGGRPGVPRWRAALIVANGANLDVDYPLLLGLSFEDIGTGIMVFVLATLALGLGADQAEPARRVISSAGLAGVAAMLVDRFIV